MWPTTMWPTPHSQWTTVTPMSQHQAMPSPSGCHPKWCVVEAALAAWCAEKNFRDTTVNMVKLSQSIGVVRRVLSIYFDQHLHTTFRIWLSDIRFKEAQDYIKAHPEYTNESVSSACGFTSRSQLYRIFSARTGMTPREWRDGQMA